MKASIALLSIALVAALSLRSGALAEPLNNINDNSGQISGLNQQIQAEPATHELIGNPLWAIPLATLSETRQRPLFTPSRRAPPSVSTRILDTPPSRTSKKPDMPERPRLVLVGTIVGNADGFGLFINSTTKAVIRLRTGTSYQGWTLRSVREREAVLEKERLNITLSLPRHERKSPTIPLHDEAQLSRKPDGVTISH